MSDALFHRQYNDFAHGSDFQFGHANVEMNCSFMSSSSPSCPSTAGSSRRSSDVSFTGSSFTCFSPGSPISSAMHFDGLITQSNQTMNQLVSFSTAPQFCDKQVPNSGPCGTLYGKNLERDNFYVSYACESSAGENLPHDYPIGTITFCPDQIAEGRTSQEETGGGSGEFVQIYPNDIGPVMADEMADMSYFGPSPPFVIPSQMIHNDAHFDPRTESPEVSQDGILDSYYHSDGTVVAVAYRLPDADTAPNKRKGSLTGSHPGSRKRSTAAKFLDASGGSSRFPVRALRPECTRATATRSKKFKCSLCTKGFDRQEHYKRHLISETHRKMLEESDKKSLGPPPKKYECPACQRCFNRHDNLKPHIKTHLMTEGKHRHNPSVTVEESIRYGWEDLDPRINKPALLKANSKRKGR